VQTVVPADRCDGGRRRVRDATRRCTESAVAVARRDGGVVVIVVVGENRVPPAAAAEN